MSSGRIDYWSEIWLGLVGTPRLFWFVSYPGNCMAFFTGVRRTCPIWVVTYLLWVLKKNRVRRPRGLGLADALFSTTQQRVLGLIFGQPDRSFYATESVALAGSGSGAVQRELARLEETALVTVKRIGTQKHYQANPVSPLYAELCVIVQKTVGLAEPLRKALAPVASGIVAAFVYGSVAKRQDTAVSDIDVMVVSQSPAAARRHSPLKCQAGPARWPRLSGHFQADRSAGWRSLKVIWVTDARTLPGYRLRVRFSDGIEGEIDLKDFIASDTRPIVAALCDPFAAPALCASCAGRGRAWRRRGDPLCDRQPGQSLAVDELHEEWQRKRL